MSVTQNAKPAVQTQPAMAALVCAKKIGMMLQNDSRLCGTVVSSVSLLFYNPEAKKVQQKRPGNNWLLLYYLLVNKLKCWLFAATADLFSARGNGAGKFLYKGMGRWLLYRFRNTSAELFWSMHSKENLHTCHSLNLNFCVWDLLLQSCKDHRHAAIGCEATFFYLPGRMRCRVKWQD